MFDFYLSAIGVVHSVGRESRRSQSLAHGYAIDGHGDRVAFKAANIEAVVAKAVTRVIDLDARDISGDVLNGANRRILYFCCAERCDFMRNAGFVGGLNYRGFKAFGGIAGRCRNNQERAE